MNPTIGKIEQLTTTPTNGNVRRVVKVVPQKKTPEDYQRDHEIALLKLLAPKHPHIVLELVDALVK